MCVLLMVLAPVDIVIKGQSSYTFATSVREQEHAMWIINITEQRDLSSALQCFEENGKEGAAYDNNIIRANFTLRVEFQGWDTKTNIGFVFG